MRICPSCNYEGVERTCPTDGFPTVDTKHLKSDEDAPILIGKVFDERYEVKQLVGKGANGWVLKATHRAMGQDVALKILKKEIGKDIKAIRRFFHEARASSKLRHPNTIRVYDFGQAADGSLFLAMEFLDGQPLSKAIAEQGALPPARCVHIARQACDGLDEAHDKGLVHRDIKPENMYICQVHRKTDFVKILDFGLAKAIDGKEIGARVTSDGFLVGSPGYIAPEQALAMPVDRRADLYSLGVSLYEMLSGRLPFSGETTEQLLKAHVRQPAPPLPTQIGDHVIPERLRQLVRRLLSKSPDERPASAAAVEAELALVAAELEGRPVPVEGIATLGDLDGEGPSQVDTQGRPLSGSGSMDLPASLRKLPPWAGWAAAGVAVLALVIALVAIPGESAEADAGPAVAAGPLGAKAGLGARVVQDPSPGRVAAAQADAAAAPDAGAAGDPDAGARATGAPDAAAGDTGPAGGAPAPVTPTAPLDERKLVQVTSSPRGATVTEAGKALGRTPLGLWVRPGEARALVVRRRGYKDTEHVLRLEDAPEIKLELEAKKRKPKVKVKLL